jgi:hypothetical protein
MTAKTGIIDMRSRVADYIGLLASAEEQMAYERAVPHVPVPVEITEGFASDLYHPKSPDFVDAFSDSELKSIARLYGLVCAASEGLSLAGARSVTDALKTSGWRAMMNYAKTLMGEFAP